MFKPLFRIKSRASAYNRKAVNKAILRETGLSDYFPDEDSFIKAQVNSFLTFHGAYFIIWEDMG